jgi:hypothetical protein
MKARTTNPNNREWKSYGGRGIKVCYEWLNSFEKFYEDMGDCPKGQTLGRINNDLGYCKSNCRWETRYQQANNRQYNRWLTYNGVKRTVSQWARELGITTDIIRSRLRRGRSIKDALSTTFLKRRHFVK